MENGEGNPEFSLLGGPLYRLGCRLGLVRDETNTTALGLVLGVVPWIVLAALALAEGVGATLFSMGAIGAHARLLVAIPLYFVCETVIDPRFGSFVSGIVRSQIVSPSALPALESEVARIVRWRDSWLPEAILLVAVVILGLAAPQTNLMAQLPGNLGGSSPSGVSAETWSSQWYWFGCMTLFRFLLMRWLWRLAMWCFFLWRLARLDLRLLPTHPDHAGGLGYLDLVHTEFVPLIFAISAVQSATFAQDIASGRMTLEATYPGIVLMLLVDAVLFVAPLCTFSRKLWNCQVKGRSDYGALAERYVKAFEEKWLNPDAVPDEPLLGSADIQSLADLGVTADRVQDLRLVPASTTMLVSMAVAALVPLLPLALFKYPVAELLSKFVSRMVGG